jgi:hypothetical protein
VLGFEGIVKTLGNALLVEGNLGPRLYVGECEVFLILDADGQKF